MVEIICEDGEFLVKGSFSMGIAGTSVNEEFGDENIDMLDWNVEDIVDELKKENSFFFEPLRPYLKENMEDGDAIAKGLTAYYNQKEKEIKENEKQINDCILYHLFENLVACAYPFWEIEEAILPNTLDMSEPDSLYEVVYTDKTDEVYEWCKDFYNVPNNGTVEKVDVEGRLRELFPMFNFDGLFESIVPEGVSFEGRFISFQFSDGWGADLLCAAYDELDENFVFMDWHNH